MKGFQQEDVIYKALDEVIGKQNLVQDRIQAAK